MMWAISKQYHALPDQREMCWHEIRFWYEGIRADLIESARAERESKRRTR